MFKKNCQRVFKLDQAGPEGVKSSQLNTAVGYLFEMKCFLVPNITCLKKKTNSKKFGAINPVYDCDKPIISYTLTLLRYVSLHVAPNN